MPKKAEWRGVVRVLVVREVAYGAGQRKFEPGSCLPLLRGHTPGDTVRCLYNGPSNRMNTDRTSARCVNSNGRSRLSSI